MTTPPRIQHVESWWAAGTIGAAFVIMLLCAFTDWTGTKARAAEMRYLYILDNSGAVILHTTVRGEVETRAIVKATHAAGGGKIAATWWEWTDIDGHTYEQSFGPEGPFLQIQSEAPHD